MAVHALIIRKSRRSRRTLPQAAAGQGLLGRAEAQLSAHHGGGQQVPVVVTYGAPLSVFQHLHAALAHDGPAAETDQRLLRRPRQRKTEPSKKNQAGTFKSQKTTYLGYSGASCKMTESDEHLKRSPSSGTRAPRAGWLRLHGTCY